MVLDIPVSMQAYHISTIGLRRTLANDEVRSIKSSKIDTKLREFCCWQILWKHNAINKQFNEQWIKKSFSIWIAMVADRCHLIQFCYLPVHVFMMHLKQRNGVHKQQQNQTNSTLANIWFHIKLRKKMIVSQKVAIASLSCPYIK